VINYRFHCSTFNVRACGPNDTYQQRENKTWTAWIGTRARAGVGQTRPRLGRTLRFPTTMFSSNSRPLPQRTHSVNAVKHANYFSALLTRNCVTASECSGKAKKKTCARHWAASMARVEEMVRSYSDPPDAACHRIPVLTIWQCATLKSSYQTNRGSRDAAQGRPIEPQARASEH
jgi:hypothetical protein